MSHRSSRGFGSRNAAVHGCVRTAQAVMRDVSAPFRVRAEAAEGPHTLFSFVSM